jgi:hypothetical protein
LPGGEIPRRVACAGGCVRWRARRYRFEVVLVDRSFDCRRRRRRMIPGFLGESSQERGSGLQEEIVCVGGRGHRVAARLRGDLWSRGWPSLWAPGLILSAKGAPDRRSLSRGRVRGGVGPGISRSLHGEAWDATGGVRGPSRASRVLKTPRRGAPPGGGPSLRERTEAGGARPTPLPPEVGAPQGGPALRCGASSPRFVSRSARRKPGARESTDPRGARVGASVADGGSRRLFSWSR